MNLFTLFSKKKSSKPKASATVNTSTIQAIQFEWRNIDAMLLGGQPSQLKQALISADKCLDNALKSVIPGETMGERLKNARSKFDQVVYNRVWNGHKMRNTLVHEAGVEMPGHVIKNAIADLKSGLEALGINV